MNEQSIHVLLVDDDSRLLNSLQRNLTEAGFIAETAISAEEALAMLKQNQFDVIVSDNRMTGASGMRLLATVAKQHPEVVRFMLTGDISATQAWVVSHEIGVSQVFAKPCDPNVIVEQIREAVVGQTQPLD